MSLKKKIMNNFRRAIFCQNSLHNLLPKFPINLYCKLDSASCHRKGFCEQPITCTCVRWTNTLSRTGACYDAERHTKVRLISGQQVLALRRCAVAVAVFVGRKRAPAAASPASAYGEPSLTEANVE